MHKIGIGGWREDKTGSGPIGKKHVHYEAPAAKRLGKEMHRFLAWFNKKAEIDPVLKAAQAHYWFVTHPFDDGKAA